MNRMVRMGLAVVLGAGTLGAAGWMLFAEARPAEAALAPEWQPDFPAFGGARFYPMADQGNLDGQAFKLAYFSVRATPEEVLRFYAAYWKNKGLVTDGAGTPSGGRVTALDTRDGSLRTVAARREGDRLTVFCSVMPRGAPQVSGSIPLPPEAVVSDSLVMDGMQTLTYVIPGTVEQERKAMTERLGARGWKPVDARTREDKLSVSLEFENAGAVAHATLARESQDRAVAVQLHVSAPRGFAGPQP